MLVASGEDVSGFPHLSVVTSILSYTYTPLSSQDDVPYLLGEV